MDYAIGTTHCVLTFIHLTDAFIQLYSSSVMLACEGEEPFTFRAESEYKVHQGSVGVY